MSETSTSETSMSETSTSETSTSETSTSETSTSETSMSETSTSETSMSETSTSETSTSETSTSETSMSETSTSETSTSETSTSETSTSETSTSETSMSETSMSETSTSETSTSEIRENLFTVAEEELEDNYYFSVLKNQTTETFIESVKVDAQEVAWTNDLYASVMIAQAILETGSGNSVLSSAPNYNLFGIKGDYKGTSVVMDTKEDSGNGEMYSIKSAFRKYPGYKESLIDYATLFKEGISGNRFFYQNTWKSKSKSYQDVTSFLTGTYATDTRYGQKLDALIETYQLTKYDSKPQNDKKMNRSSKEAKKMNTIEEHNKTTKSKKMKRSNKLDKNEHLENQVANNEFISQEKEENSKESNKNLLVLKIKEIPIQTRIDLR
ncbi:TPA: glucosaminidase domain-containing protein [Enterococcus faecalis]